MSAFLYRWKANAFFVDIKINGKSVATGYGEAQVNGSGARIANTSGTFPVEAGDKKSLLYKD